MKKLKVFCCLVLAAIMFLSGCTSEVKKTEENTAQGTEEKGNAAQELPPVKLKMYFLGEPGPENDMVFKEISRILKEKINAELEPAYLAWGDYQQRYPLLFTSGEDFDLIFAATFVMFPEIASKGGFHELTREMLEKYCPLIMENLPEEAWTSTKINGKNYMIPYQNFFANHYGAIIRGDLRKKYGMSELKTVEDIEAFMQKVAENEPGMVPLSVSRDNAEMIMRAIFLYPMERYNLVGNSASSITYAFADPNKLDLVPFYELPGFVDYLKRIRSWNEKGFISKSDLTSSNTDRFEAGKSAVKFDNLGNANTAWQMAKTNHPDWEIEYVNLLEGKRLGSDGFGGGPACAINARSKNVERALMAADLLSYDPELNYLINNGIPGVHSRLVNTLELEGHKFLQIETLKPGAYGGISYWCFSNQPTLPLESFEGYNELTASYYYKQLTRHPIDGIMFDTEKVNAQIATYSSLIAEYLPVLYLGFAEDPEATLNEFIAKSKEAGEEELNAELIRQAEALFQASQQAK